MAAEKKEVIRYKCEICGGRRGPRKRNPDIPPQCCGKPMKIITATGKK